MKDYVFARKNNTKEFIQTAEQLGYKELILIYTEEEVREINKEEQQNIREGTTLKLYFGIREGKRPLPKGFEEHAALGTKIQRISSGITIIYNNENEEEKDYIHQRRSGLNHVFLQEILEKNIKILAGTSQLRQKPLWEQERILGRIRQNIKLAKKKNVTYEIASLAEQPLDMRSAKDMQALKRELEKNEM